MNQKTIRYPVSIQGIGLHTGDTCTVKLSPSDPNTGITFYLNHNKDIRVFYSDARRIINPICSTNIGDDSASISTIEHLMACLHVMGIDNIKITVVGNELPILDGSAIVWWKLLKTAETQPQNAIRKFGEIQEPYEYSSGNSHIYAEPYDGLEIRMKIDFDHPAIGKQTEEFYFWEYYDIGYEMGGHEDYFESQIAPARTFGVLDHIKKMQDKGLLKGGTLENAIVLDDKEIINPPLRMDDEFVKHKMLDFIGDIYVNGPIKGFFDVCCTSHQFNNQAIRSIFQQLN